jgi:hypothetical protein
MEQCPLAYIDPCSKCAQFGNCCPSQAVQKLAALENLLQDLKKMLQCLADKK